MKKRHRIFIAINLPIDIKKTLADVQKKWSELPAKWTNVENLHITLVFLGDLEDIEIGQVCITVKEIAKKYSTFDIHFNNISYGPDDKKFPKMVWVNGKKPKELSGLKRDLENALLETVKNFKEEKRSFKLHITLARIQQLEFRNFELEERPDINETVDLNFTVESIEVMSSRARSRFEGEKVLKKGGPQYIIIESFQLK